MNRPAILNVHGSAACDVAPDFARVPVMIQSTRKERTAALGAVEMGTESVRSTLAQQPGLRSVVLSGVRVEQAYRWDQKKGVQVAIGWRAEVTGRIDVAVDEVAAVVALLVDAGAVVGGVGWLLSDDNPVYRHVRRDAVADAFRAAGDFADALQRPLGALRTLADAGLLGAAVGPPMPRAMAGMQSGAPVEAAAVELDPEPQHVTARVEASFELG